MENREKILNRKLEKVKKQAARSAHPTAV